MLLPYNTNAPILFRPWCTGALILLNAIAFFALVLPPEVDIDGLVLVRGDGLRPLEWLTSNFIHLDLGHLAGNMLFLWVFGIIVEGELGWWRFLLVFLGIGAVQCGLEQFWMLSAPDIDYSSGASAIIYGLMAMAMVWAPDSEISFFYWFWRRAGTAQFATFWVAILYVIYEVMWSFPELHHGEFGSALLHLMGAGIGLPVALVLLRTGVVDCEGEDLLAKWFGRKPQPPKRAEEEAEPAPSLQERQTEIAEAREDAEKLVIGYLDEGDAASALQAWNSAVAEHGRWDLPENLLWRLIDGLQRAKLWRELKPLLREAGERFPQRAAPLRLLEAKILIEIERRPKKGLEILAALETNGELSPSNRRARELLRSRAQAALAGGEMELELDD